MSNAREGAIRAIDGGKFRQLVEAAGEEVGLPVRMTELLCEVIDIQPTIDPGGEVARLTAALESMTAEHERYQAIEQGLEGVTLEQFAEVIKSVVAKNDGGAYRGGRLLTGEDAQRYYDFIGGDAKRYDAMCAELDAMTAERDAAQRRAEAAEKDMKEAISISPYAICGLFCKNHKPGCGGINCRPEWRGPDAGNKPKTLTEAITKEINRPNKEAT